MKKLFLGFAIMLSMLVVIAYQASAVTPGQFGLREGDLISGTGPSDPDIYIVNENGYKRLFLNSVIFSYYGHLGGFTNVKHIAPGIRDSFITSGLFRNCETGDQKIYGVEITGEDTGTLHWINTTGAQAVQDDPQFFSKVFCINTLEFNWYAQGYAYTSVLQVPNYTRIGTVSPPKITLVNPSSGPIGTTVTIYGNNFTSTNNTIHIGGGYINGLTSYGRNQITLTLPEVLGVCGYNTQICITLGLGISPGSYPLEVINANGTSNTAAFTVTSGNQTNLVIQNKTLTPAIYGDTYSQSITAEGGSDSYTWSIVSGALPPGLSLHSVVCIQAPCQTPVYISGTPTTENSAYFTIQVTSGTQRVTRQFFIEGLPGA